MNLKLFLKTRLSAFGSLPILLVILFSFLKGFTMPTSGPVILYVDADATAGLNDGTSWANAYVDLQSALAAVHADCDIWVAKGTYKPTGSSSRLVSFNIPDSVRVYGGFAGNEISSYDIDLRDFSVNASILSGDIGVVGDSSDNSYNVVKTLNVSAQTLLDGFTIQDGNASSTSVSISNLNCGAGWYNEASGSGFFSNPNGKNIVFINNLANASGGAMSNRGVSLGEAGVSLENCIFEGNWVDGVGGGLHFNGITEDAPANLINVAFVGNHASGFSGFGGGCFIASSSGSNAPVLKNCTFLSNRSRYGGGLYLREIGGTLNAIISNSVFWKNSAYSWGFGDVRSGIERNGGAFSLSSSLLQDSVITINDNISGLTDPKFLNVESAFDSPNLLGDFRLTPCSPLINMGSNIGVAAKDVFNKPRHFNANVDIGAYEFQGNTAGTVVFVDDDKGYSGGGSSWLDAYSTIQKAQKVLDVCPSLQKIWVAQGTYFPSDTTRNASFVFTDALKIYGGFIGNEDTTAFDLSTRDFVANASILSGDINTKGDSLDNSFHVVRTTNVTSNTIVDGFTITHGHASGQPFSDQLDGAGWYNDGSSGGNSAPTIRNCTFSKNYARNGGGIHNRAFEGNASPKIENCTFVLNRVTFNGGGINNDAYQDGLSSPSIFNCRFAGNIANRGAGITNNGGNGGESSSSIIGCLFSGNVANLQGGAIFNAGKSSPLILNGTFAGNYAAVDGGALYNDGNGYTNEPMVTNCIFWDNFANYPENPTPNIYSYDSSPQITYSMLQKITNTTDGNISTIDPKFVSPLAASEIPSDMGDFNLQVCSPMTDMGINDSLPGFYSVDLAADPRIYNATNLASAIVDLGAYEYQSVTYPVSLNLVNDINTDTNSIVTEDITANNSVINPARVLYQAGESILLNEGFEVENGSVFRAEIGLFTCP